MGPQAFLSGGLPDEGSRDPRHRSEAVPEGLRDQWRRSSLASVWLRPSDWYHPAVDALADAVLSGGDPARAAQELGRARSYDGVGLGEALDDLTCLYDSMGAHQPPMPVVRALCEGWTDEQAGAFATSTSVDAETGLPTQQYLQLRLTEAYARAQGSPGSLTVIDVAAGEVSGFLRAARSAAMGASLEVAFGPGWPMASLGGGVFVVVGLHDEDPGERITALRDEVARRCSDVDVRVATRLPLRVTTHVLPATRSGAEALLTRLTRPDR